MIFAHRMGRRYARNDPVAQSQCIHLKGFPASPWLQPGPIQPTPSEATGKLAPVPNAQIVLVVVVVLVVGEESKWLRKDGRMDEGSKQAAKSKKRMEAAGVSRIPPRKRPTTNWRFWRVDRSDFLLT